VALPNSVAESLWLSATVLNFCGSAAAQAEPETYTRCGKPEAFRKESGEADGDPLFRSPSFQKDAGVPLRVRH